MGSFLTDVETIRRRARAEIRARTHHRVVHRRSAPPSRGAQRGAGHGTGVRTSLQASLLHGVGPQLPAAGRRVPRSTRQRNSFTPTRWRRASSNFRASPTSTRPASRSRSHAEYVEGDSLVEMIKEDLVAERVAIAVVPGDHPLDRQRRPDDARDAREHSGRRGGARRRPAQPPSRAARGLTGKTGEAKSGLVWPVSMLVKAPHPCRRGADSESDGDGGGTTVRSRISRGDDVRPRPAFSS